MTTTRRHLHKILLIGSDAALKKKLLAEMADGLKKEGRLLSVLDIVQGAAKHAPDPRLKFPKEQKPAFDILPLEKAFSKTSQLLFGQELSGIDEYGKFLQKHVPMNVPAKSALSGNEVLVCSYRTHLLDMYRLLGRMATDDELRGIGAFPLDPGRIERLEFNMGSLVETLHPVAYTNLDKIAGICSNYKDATVVIDAQDVYRGSAFSWCKKCSHAFWVSVSEAIFGSVLTFESSFSMKCFYSKKMMRSLECDSCEACSDLYFGHNCENVRDSMFCFNAKNLSHAIGNAEMPLEQYKKVKSSLVSQMAGELEKKHDLRWDIFNIGARGAHK